MRKVHRRANTSKPKNAKPQNSAQDLSTLSEPEMLSVFLATYWKLHPQEDPEAAFAAFLKCSQQHIINCRAPHGTGHLGAESYLELELRTGLSIWSDWINQKRKEVER